MFEKQAVAAPDPAADVEGWPLLTLTDASVTVCARRGDPEKIVDLFEIDERGPFRVRGRLQKVPAKFRAIVTKDNVYEHVLEIPKVVTYSIERDRKKAIVIWVLGSSAWYALSPSEEYRPVFERLLEKANLWLFLRDVYSSYIGTRKKMTGTALELCKEYTEYEPKCKTARAASKLFHSHHRFLIFEMLRQPDEVKFWQHTPWYLEFAETYPEVCEEAQEALTSPPSKKPNPHHRNPTVLDSPPVATPQPASPIPEAMSECSSGDEIVVRSSLIGDYVETSSSSEDDGRMRTRSSKGKSTLRPKRVKTIPDAIAEGESAEHDPYTESPTLTRLKRKLSIQEHEHAPAAAGPSERLLSLTATPEPPSEDWPKLRSGRGRPPIVTKSRVVVANGNTPGGKHWKCTLGGLDCTHIVYNAKTREGQREIEEHYEMHGRVVEEAMETIGLETQKSEGYQVDNLLAKIEGMAKKWAESKPPPLRELGE